MGFVVQHTRLIFSMVTFKWPVCGAFNLLVDPRRHETDERRPDERCC